VPVWNLLWKDWRGKRVEGVYGEFIAHYELFEHPFAENFWFTTVFATMLCSFYFLASYSSSF